MEIKNQRYIEIMLERCKNADVIKEQMLASEYLKQQVYNDAKIKANTVYESMGTLNVTKKQARTLQKMADKRVQKLVEAELMEEMVINPFYVVK